MAPLIVYLRQKAWQAAIEMVEPSVISIWDMSSGLTSPLRLASSFWKTSLVWNSSLPASFLRSSSI